ncbi:MAG: hypothetical protein J6W21_02635 [Bacteroidaceae bacterium]|nr:hypothetical protein [Bacteroidaceae bacterium]
MKRILLLLLLAVTTQHQLLRGEEPEKMFLHPDRYYYPETWFHFVNGNVSREGITRDLEAIAESGIQGIQLFHGRMNDDVWPGTEEPIECLTPKWEDLVRHTATEAHRLGMRFSLQTCPGWAMSGGPWIKPEQAMRHLIYTRTDAEGGKPVDAVLPIDAKEDWRNWQDICVLAFPTPKGDTGHYCEVEEVRADDHQQEWERLLKEEKDFVMPPTQPGKPYRFTVKLKNGEIARSVEFNPINEFNHPFSVQPDIHVKILCNSIFKNQNSKSTTESEQWRVVLDSDFPFANWQDSEKGMTFALKDNSKFKNQNSKLTANNEQLKNPQLSTLNSQLSTLYVVEITNLHDMHIRYIRFLTAARGHNWEMEAGWTSRHSLTPALSQGEGDYYVQRNEVMDISDKMDAEGHLHWTAPEGQWTILRIGHVNTGRQNGPAPKEATGWEVNKLDTAFVTYQFNSYIGRLADRPLKGLLNNMLMDSWECSSQTWTRYMKEEFQTRRHYDLTTWMPALFGWVMDDRELTSRFLDDWRRTIHELFTQNFYGHMTHLAHQKGMTASYETAAGDIFPAGPMEYYKYADVPMTEYWQPFDNFLANHNFKPIRPTASAARMYGKPRVSAESFTSFVLTWDEHLSMLREVANQNMVEGVTHTIFHTYTHNPDADRYFPGTSFGSGIGTPFLRKQTWWPYMKHFNTYLARCAYMLERGRPVSSVLWYLGDETEQKPDQYTPFPEGFKYDYCNTDALLHRISVKDGKWVTPEGISYDLLWIPKRGRLLPETLERLSELVTQGGHLVADEPTGIATLSPYKGQLTMDNGQWTINNSIFKIQNSNNSSTRQLVNLLTFYGLKPDVKVSPLRGEVGEGLLWLHRQDEEADWYMVCPKQEQAFSGTVAFLQKGRAELWNPMNGSIAPIATQQDGDYASIDLNLSRGQMLFVVFRRPTPATSLYGGEKKALPLEGNRGIGAIGERSDGGQKRGEGLLWTLTFPPSFGEGTGVGLTLTELLPWKDLPLSDEGKAFSGTATYETTFLLDHKPKKKGRFSLNLGKVEEIAVVSVNGQVTDTLWAEPYETDITRYVRKGKNQLSIQVTSTWFNRLVYDARQPKEQRKTWVINGPSANSELRPSGLLGPVELTEWK